MPRPPRPLPPALGREFSRRRALDAGLTPRRLRATDLETPFHGARIVPFAPAAADVDDEPYARYRITRDRLFRHARAYASVMPETAFFTGRTAAALWSLPIDPGDLLTAAIHSPGRAPRARGVRGIRVEPHLSHVCDLDGIPLTTPASTWASLARELSVTELVTIGDAIVRVPRDRYGVRHPQAALATTAHLTAAARAGARAGIARLRAALPLIRVGSMSPPETELRLSLADAGMPTPSLDVEIRDFEGRLLGISELVFDAHRVVVEVEGDHHRTDRAQWQRDLDKYADYAAAGWDVVRVTSSDVRVGTGVPRIADALTRHGWRR